MSSSSIEKSCNVHLHAEITLLKKALNEKQADLASLRTRIKSYEEEFYHDHDRLIAWQDKFERLYESHKKVQKINQNLEDKLLKLVDRNSGEKAKLSSDCALLNIRLSQANYNISCLQREIERYKQDINLAIKLLHCKPDNFLPQKVSSLPLEIQSKVATYMKKDSDSESGLGSMSKGKYQILPTNDEETTTFHPPPLISFDHNKNGELKIAPIVVAKYLENELKSKNFKHCETCSCATKNLIEVEGIKFNVGTQTEALQCLRCNSNLNSPFHSNSPYLIKLKSSDSVISETKSSVSDFTNLNDKILTPSKVDDLKVNPILGHHRLCQEHTKNYQSFSTKDSDVSNPIRELREDALEKSDKKVENDAKAALQSPGNKSQNSLWSQNSNKEGVKMFENFNRNLIKTIQSENPRKLVPRICALKIQNGSNNVILGDAHYIRRPRLLDEEFLDDEKHGNIPMNFESSQSSVVLSSSCNQIDEIFSTNKTDSEKFNEIQYKDIKSPELVSNSALEGATNINFKHSEDLKDIDIVATSLSLRQTAMNSSDKYSRVAEWVANSNNIPNSPQQIPSENEAEIPNNQNVELDFQNNNQMYKETLSSQESAQNSVTEKLNSEHVCSSIKSDDKIDLAQMEYNVKKFLLKQNEWAISDRTMEHGESEEDIFIRTSFQRTETNL